MFRLLARPGFSGRFLSGQLRLFARPGFSLCTGFGFSLGTGFGLGLDPRSFLLRFYSGGFRFLLRF